MIILKMIKVEFDKTDSQAAVDFAFEIFIEAKKILPYR